MDKDLEKFFVEQYINNEFQNRILYELNSKKRLKGLMRFCHNINYFIKNKTIVNILSNPSEDEILKFFQKDNKEVYVLSFDFLEGKWFNIQEAINHIFKENFFMIIISKQNVVIKPEVVTGKAEYYFLRGF